LAKWTIADVLSKGLKHTLSAPLATPEQQGAKPNKYRNIKTTVDNIVFDSRNEAAFYGLLKASGLRFNMQVKYPLLSKETIFNDTLRSVSIIIDFEIYNSKGELVAFVDTKGMITKDAKIKLMLLRKMFPNVWMALPKNKKERSEVISELQKIVK